MSLIDPTIYVDTTDPSWVQIEPGIYWHQHERVVGFDAEELLREARLENTKPNRESVVRAAAHQVEAILDQLPFITE